MRGRTGPTLGQRRLGHGKATRWANQEGHGGLAEEAYSTGLKKLPQGGEVNLKIVPSCIGQNLSSVKAWSAFSVPSFMLPDFALL